MISIPGGAAVREILRAPGGGAKARMLEPRKVGKKPSVLCVNAFLRESVNVRCFQRAAAILEFFTAAHSHGAFLEIIQSDAW